MGIYMLPHIWEGFLQDCGTWLQAAFRHTQALCGKKQHLKLNEGVQWRKTKCRVTRLKSLTRPNFFWLIIWQGAALLRCSVCVGMNLYQNIFKVI